ncbi:hypothetical protein NBRC10512_007285 [Rhodotorula toruloides]|uniref:RHTO0S14e04918g1_1 n=2 Tax=Rhodotorula toruloides TaxID=5286 RepID=A0A061BC53_RHOTO|nr:protein bcp1 [Rhodotorula toruloides NP11]EMS24922.1 protein bcp1 [Rhodotorula toruloides NP11]CDR47529.1 RHTO0S14e04918g1_1 [Rhodotorula toruloides]
MPKRSTAASQGMDVDLVPPQQQKVGQGKRRERDEGGEEEGDEGEGGSDVEMLDVNFSFFDPQPQDYHSIKLLLSQLLQGDAASLDLGGVTDIVLEQKLVGSTVKTDSGDEDDKAHEGDPYAVLTVLNLNVHKSNKALSSLVSYILSKLPSSSAFHSTLSSLLSVDAAASSASKPSHVGLVLSERMVNMPPQIVPPMYRMLSEELQWAKDDGEPYHFSHLLFVSRVFKSSLSALDDDPNAALEAAIVAEAEAKAKVPPKKKKQRKAGGAEQEEEKLWMYHVEDEFIQKFAEHTHVFDFSNNSRRAEGGGQDQFGVDMKGQLMLVPWPKFSDIVDGLEAFVGPV